jgi:hypothetical protein
MDTHFIDLDEATAHECGGTAAQGWNIRHMHGTLLTCRSSAPAAVLRQCSP